MSQLASQTPPSTSSQITLERSSRGVSIYHFIVVSAFLLSFSLPVLFGLHAGGLFSLFSYTQSDNNSGLIFPNAFNVTNQGEYLQIGHSEKLNPKVDEGFLLQFWVNLRRIPAIGERLVVLSKYEGQPRINNGYALALYRDDQAIRPMVFWGSPGTTGRWYDFPEVSITPRQWMLFALSFSENKYLGLYHGSLIASPRNEGRNIGKLTPLAPPSDADSDRTDINRELKLLGGYELGATVIPSSSSPLIIGAAVDRNFRGNIGPIAAYSFINRSDARKLLKEHIKSPLAIPNFEGRSINFWLPDEKFLLKDQDTGSTSQRLPPETVFFSSQKGTRQEQEEDNTRKTGRSNQELEPKNSQQRRSGERKNISESDMKEVKSQKNTKKN